MYECWVVCAKGKKRKRLISYHFRENIHVLSISKMGGFIALFSKDYSKIVYQTREEGAGLMLCIFWMMRRNDEAYPQFIIYLPGQKMSCFDWCGCAIL